MTFLTGAPAACFATSGARRAPRSRSPRVGVRGHDDLAAQLAVDLQHELDLVLRERGRIDLRPRRVEQRAEFGGEAELVPQRAADVRHDRVEHAQQDRQSLAQERVRARGVGGHRFERVQHLHAGGHDGVVLDALVVVGRLLQRQVHLAPRGLHRRRRIAASRCVPVAAFTVSAWACANVHSRRRKRCAPSTPASDHTSAVLRRAGEHHEQARGVGAVSVDHVLRIDAVQLRLRHRADAAVLDRLPVGLEARAGDAALGVVRDVDVRRREVVDAALRGAAEEDVVEHHPLRQQPRERLVDLDESHVAHHLGPEARVEQVQDRVLMPPMYWSIGFQ